MNLFEDVETVGLVGMPVLIQYAFDDEPITLYEPWKWPVRETLKRIEMMLAHTVIGFNLAFDWFHITKLYNVLRLCPLDWIPEHHINEIALLEPKGHDGPALKPQSCLDLMLHARKGPYQSLMNRDPIRVRRVPVSVAQELCSQLEAIELDPIYFAKAVKGGPRWKIFPTKKPGFVDIVCTFHPSGSLKSLAQHALKITDTVQFKDIELPKHFRPLELGYAPTALALSSPEKGWAAQIKKKQGFAWPGVIQKHIEHWHCNQAARKYGENDILYTRGLYEHFNRPEPNDDDSTLACMVASLRWRGYRVDQDGLSALRAQAAEIVAASPCNINRISEVRAYLGAVMDPTESLDFQDKGTAKDVLEEMSKWTIDAPEPCSLCASPYRDGKNCPRCNDKAILEPGPHPVAIRAKELTKIKKAKKEVELYDKLLTAKRLFADFVVIGAKSSRMSGAGGVNAMAIKKTKEVRKCFQLAPAGYDLLGGDFAAFEVSIAEAVYADPDLHKCLTTIIVCPKCKGAGTQINEKTGKPQPCKQCEGTGSCAMKIHALFGELAYNKTYEEICVSEGSKVFDMYTRAKSGVFLDMYGGEAERLAKTLGITVSEAKRAQEQWQKRFPGIGKARQRIKEQFGCLAQRGEIGSEIVWTNPSDEAVTGLGFPRSFRLENRIAKRLFQIGQEWGAKARGQTPTITRKNRLQTPEGAAASAIYGAAFSIAASNVRAAGNHYIQGFGAGITKGLQRAIWDHQPQGVHDLRVMPMNVHDEIVCPTLPEHVTAVCETVERVVEGYRAQVPLIGIEWYRKWETWASKNDGTASGKMHIKAKQEDFTQRATPSSVQKIQAEQKQTIAALAS